jgi:hypothetical protein
VVSHIEGGTQAEGVPEYGVQEHPKGNELLSETVLILRIQRDMIKMYIGLHV